MIVHDGICDLWGGRLSFSYETYKANCTNDFVSMAKRFTFALRGDPAEKLEEIKIAAARSRVTFGGDLRSGWFHGGFPLLGQAISGTYTIVGKSITVTVDEKPSLMSWEEVESRLRGFIEG